MIARAGGTGTTAPAGYVAAGGQAGTGAYTHVDAPYNTVNGGTSINYVTVCAVCETTGKSDVILGCANFTFNQSGGAVDLKKDPKQPVNPGAGGWTPSSGPGSTWTDALANWNKDHDDKYTPE